MYKYELAAFVYLAIRGNLPLQICTVFTLNSGVHQHATRQQNNPHVLQTRTVRARNSLFHQATKVWSEIPMFIRQSDSICVFKRRLKIFLLDKS